jgi:hypothetical protein
MKKRLFVIPVLGAAFLLSGCESPLASAATSFSGAGSASSAQGTSSESSAKASSSGEGAFGYFDVFNNALLSYLGQDNQAAVYTDPDLTSYTGVSLSEDSAEDTSSGFRYTGSAIDAAMNHAATADSSKFQARALISGAQVYTDDLGSGTLKAYNKNPEDIDLYLANDALYYNFKGPLLWAYFGGLLRADLIAQGYEASLRQWAFPQKGYYPFTGDDLSNYESLFPLTAKMETFGALASPLLKDAYGINKNDFAFAHDSTGYTLDYSVTDPLDLYQLAQDLAAGIQEIDASSNPYSSGFADAILEDVEKLEPIFKATTLHKFEIVFSFTADTLISSRVDIDMAWDKTAIKAALLKAGQDDSTYPLSFKLSGSAAYDYGDAALFALPSFSGYPEVTKPNIK